MGKSDPIYFSWIQPIIKPMGKVALLGFTDEKYFQGDLYDLSLGNWNINTKWKLNQKYDSIICTRCAYFAKDPLQFIELCYEHLNPKGRLYVDWGLGDHWRFPNYKVGWLKDGEHEWAYKEDNYLWSTVWDESFIDDEQFKTFSKRIQKHHYKNVKEAIFDEVPNVVSVASVEKFFTIKYDILTLWEDLPQLYILLSAIKN